MLPESRRSLLSRRAYIRTGTQFAIAFIACAVSACGGDPEIEPPTETPTSPTANVKIKNGQRLQRELSRTLDLAPGEICNELGRFDCFGIHSVVLGNTDAFGSGLYKPLPETTSTSPIAVERLILSGCTQRADADLDNPATAVLFGALELNADGGLADLDADSVSQTIDGLYQRALSRRAKDTEIDHLKQLYRDIEASGRSQTPARDWATLGCFSVLTTMEALFY